MPAFSSLNTGIGYWSILRWNRGGGSRLNYDALWKLMADLVAELRRSGELVPSDVMKDLRSAKTMIEILKVDKSRSECLLRVEEYLNNVESYVMPAAKMKFGEEYANEWMKRILEAQSTVRARREEPTRRFPIGIPRDKLWVRMEPSNEMPKGKIKRLAKEEGLDFRTENDGYILVYGEESRLKTFVKKTAELLRDSEGPSPDRVESMPAEGSQEAQ